MAAAQLKDFTYVDDSVMDVAQEDVDRMRGHRVEGGYTGTVARILQKVTMTVKFMAVTGSDDGEEEKQLAGSALGYSTGSRNTRYSSISVHATM